MVVSAGSATYEEAIARLLAGVERRGLTLFARIDHAEAARAAGLELAYEEVVIVGDPRAGTPLMQRDPRVGIELPLHLLVWQADDGVRVGYHDPRALAAVYELGDAPVLERMAALLAELAAEACGLTRAPATGPG